MIFPSFFCPVCGNTLKYHSRYFKKLYAKNLLIFRGICQNTPCGKTHALIPEKSVPGTSIGTRELNHFILQRASGKTIDQAGQVFINAGMSPDYPEIIHKRLKRYCKRLWVIFTGKAIHPGTFYTDLTSCFPEKPDIVSHIHSQCPGRGFNPVFFSRVNILVFPKTNTGKPFSRNPPSRPPP